MNLLRIISCLLCLPGWIPGISVAGGDQGTLELDRARLAHKWVMRGMGREWTINFAPAGDVQIAISWRERGGTWAATGWSWTVHEDAQGRYVELDEATAQTSDLPRRLYYSFDGADLILEVSEGPLQGRHQFAKSPGRAHPRALWNLGVGLLVVALMAVAVVLFSLQRRKFREPVTIAPPNPESTSSLRQL